MENTYLIIEMILAVVFVIATLALSEKFLQVGIRNWGWILAGFLLVLVGGIIGAAFSVQSFARLFVPEVAKYALAIRDSIRLAGFVIIFLTFFLSVLRLHGQRKKDQKREDSLLLLDSIRDKVNQSLSLIELVNLSVRELVESTASEAGCVFIFNPNRKQLVLAAHRNLQQTMERKLENIDDEGSIFFRALKGSRPYIVGNAGNADRVTSSLLTESAYKSLLVVPLLGRNESFGVAVLFSTEAYFFTREQIQLVSSAANILGPAVGSFRMERELREVMLGYKKQKKSNQITSDILGFISNAENVHKGLRNLAEYVKDNIGVNSIAVYKLTEGILKRVYTSGTALEPADEILEHARKSIIGGKSLLVRSEAKGLPEKVLIIPAGDESSQRQAVIMRLSSETGDLQNDEIKRFRFLARVINLQLEMESSKAEISVSQSLPEFEVDELNDLNNVLTGILGNAQLLSGNVRRDSVEDGDHIVASLDKIVDEAFQAGQLIKNLQKKIHHEHVEVSAKTEIESVLKSITFPLDDAIRPLRCLNEKPSLRFTFVSNRNGSVDLPSDEVRSILVAVFAWLDMAWQPQSELSVKLMDTKNGVNFLISEAPLDKLMIRVDDLEYKPLSDFPDSRIAVLNGGGLPVEFCQIGEDVSKRLLVIRFPHGVNSQVWASNIKERPRILAIDDQEVIRDLLASMLEELDYPYDICPDGLSGVQSFENNSYEILITDLGLPDIDGWEVARRVRNIKPATPVIVISGWGIETVRKKAPADLADFILAKPFRMEQLGELIKAAEELRRSPA